MIHKSNSNYNFSNEDIESLKKYSNLCLNKYENKKENYDTKPINELDKNGYGFYCNLEMEHQLNKKNNKFYGIRKHRLQDYLYNPYKIEGSLPNNKDIEINNNNIHENSYFQYFMTCTTSILTIASIYILFKE